MKQARRLDRARLGAHARRPVQRRQATLKSSRLEDERILEALVLDLTRAEPPSTKGPPRPQPRRA